MRVREIWLTSFGSLILLPLALTSACSAGSHGVEGEIVGRLPRPHGVEEAWVTEDSGNATTATVRRVFISFDHGAAVDMVLMAEADIRVRWASAERLEISYSCGRVQRFTNFSRRYIDGNFERQIQIVLHNDSPLRCS